MRNPTHGAFGFTLVEVLVALSIMGLLAVLGAQLLQQSARIWGRAGQVSESSDAIEAIQSMLRQEMMRARPKPADKKAGGEWVFEAADKSLRFLAPLPEALGADFAEIKLFTREDGNMKKHFVMAWRAAPDAPWKEKILIEDVADVRFGYYGPGVGADAAWREDWKDRSDLPRVIRLTVDFSQRDGRSWPYFAVAPLISADVTCVYEPTTRKCAGQ